MINDLAKEIRDTVYKLVFILNQVNQLINNFELDVNLEEILRLEQE